jgi:hypothetical protein
MTKVSELPPQLIKHVMLYGPPKIGKTALVGELAEHGYYVDILDLDGGGNVLVTRLSASAKERVEVFRIPDSKAWPVAIETCLKISKGWSRKSIFKICSQHGKIDCPTCTKLDPTGISTLDFSKYDSKHVLCIDNLTQLSNSSMAQITKEEDDLYQPLRGDYMNQGFHLAMFLGNVQAAPINIVVISHEMGIEIETGGTKVKTGLGDGAAEKDKGSTITEKIQPIGGTRNFSRTVPRYFDEVIYMRMFNNRHQAVSETTALKDVMAGSRSAAIMSKMEEPSLVGIFDGSVANPTLKEQATALLKTVKI